MGAESVRVDRDVLEDLPEYRPLSFAAVASVVLVVPGLLGYFHPAFLIFPILATVLAIVALRRMASKSFKISGRGAALTALSVSVLLICFTIFLHLLNARREYQYAANCTQQWLNLLREDKQREAYFLTLPVDQRPERASDEAVTEIRVNNRATVYDTEREFVARSDISALANAGNQVKLNGLVGMQETGKRASYIFLYEIHAPNLKPSNQFAIIEALKMPGRDGVNYWQIANCQLVAR